MTNIKLIPPVDSEKLAQILRKHDIYITASENDPCSNSLIEGLACGLPAIYRNSGGHPELVKGAGLPFEKPEDIPSQIVRLYENHESFRSFININTITDMSKQYLDAIFNNKVAQKSN